MVVSCPKCQKRYRISQKAAHVPQSIPCPACKAKIPLSRLQRAIKAQSIAKAHGIHRITCPGCNTSYRIPQDKIPAGKTRARCKACGSSMDLRPILKNKVAAASSPSASIPSAPEKRLQPAASEPALPQSTRQPTKRRKGIMVALILVLVGALAAMVWFTWRHRVVEPQSPAPDPVLPAAMNPVATIHIQAPRMMALFRQHAGKQSHAELWHFIEQIEALKLSAIEVAIYPNTSYGALPVLALRGGKESFYGDWLAEQAWLGPYLSAVDDNRYRFNKTAFAEKHRDAVPLDIYELRLVANDCIIAPRPLFHAAPEGVDLIANTPVARFAAELEVPNHVVTMAARLTARVSPGWERRLIGHPLTQHYPQVDMWTSWGVMLVQRLSEPLQQLEYLGMGAGLGKNQRRLLRYAQQFRPEIDGTAIYQKLQNRNINLAPGILSDVILLLADPRLETGARFNANRLNINFGWNALDDKEVLKAFSDVALGNW